MTPPPVVRFTAALMWLLATTIVMSPLHAWIHLPAATTIAAHHETDEPHSNSHAPSKNPARMHDCSLCQLQHASVLPPAAAVCWLNANKAFSCPVATPAIHTLTVSYQYSGRSPPASSRL